MIITPKKLDGHLHLLGNGSSGSGCELNLKGLRRLQARYMVQHLGMPQSSLEGDFDRIYIKRIHQLVKESSLEGAMLLAHEHAYDEQGRVINGAMPFYVPNHYLLQICREHSCFFPAVSIHPARPDALEELERCIEGGALMLKCLPNCQNINCNDKRFIPFWERLAQAGIILLAHTGGELSLPVISPQYSAPDTLQLPLECGVTVIAAHAATNSFFDRNYFPEFVTMLERYPRLYGDISALNTPLRSKHLKACLDPAVSARLVYGSDIPIPISGLWAALRGLINWQAFRRIQRYDNVLERDYQLKRAMGFPEDVFTRLSGLLKETA